MLLLPTVFFGFHGTDAYEIMMGIMILEAFAYIFSFTLGVVLAVVVGSMIAICKFIKTISRTWS